jgi:hypothetical protein
MGTHSGRRAAHGFVIVGINNIGNDAFEGQDYGYHVLSTLRLLHNPRAWFAQDITHRPLIYWLAIDGFHLTDGRAPFAFASGVSLVLNTGALWLVHDSTRRFIAQPMLRITALALIAFWPVTLITTVVFAADALAQPFFALLCWSLLRWREVPSERAAAAFAALAGIALALGNFAKFTFVLLPAGVLLLAFLAWRLHQATPKRILALLILGGLAPTTVGGWLHHKSTQALERESSHHVFNWKGTGEMSWRSLLLPKWTDQRIFEAPGYWDPEFINGKEYLPLLRENDYSYPALLHLGTFSDVLDFANGGSQRSWRPRPEPQKTFSKWSVRLGVVFTVLALVSLVVFTTRTVRALVNPRLPVCFNTAVWFILGLNWYVPLVITLPVVEHAYQWGYWLPRLVVPALWSFGLCLFAWMGDRIVVWPSLARGIAILAGLQVCLQIGSVWY